MAKTESRNAYFRGWFAARARRPVPAGDAIEDFFYIDMGFTQGKRSGGKPLKLWSKDIEPGMPANLDIEVSPDRPVFSTRARQEPSMARGDKPHSAHPSAKEERHAPAAAPPVETFPEEAIDADETGHNPRLPEKVPQYKFPSRPAYASGKRRPVRFAR